MSAPGYSRLLIGALAGIAATAAMTSAMSRLHQKLPEEERYPLPPRELTEGRGKRMQTRDVALAAHFGFGAAAGSVMAFGFPKAGPALGAVLGFGVWFFSYFGWVPAMGILKPADKHPPRRNALMIGVHLIWGAVAAVTVRELLNARETMLAPGPRKDA